MRTHLHIIIVIMGALLLAGCAGKSAPQPSFAEFSQGDSSGMQFTAAQHEQMADDFLRRGNPEMAFVHYNKGLSQDPANHSLRIKKGQLLEKKGLDEQALTEYMKVLSEDPDDSIANGAAGAVYFRSGLYTEARAYLEKSIRLNPLLWKSQNYLGILNDRDGNYDAAEKHFRAALDLHHGNDSAQIHNNLGVVYIARRDYAKAIDSFRQALKQGAVTSRTYNNLGLALARLDRLDEALESFKYAGGDSKANNNLGFVLLTDDQPAKAIPYFERALDLAPQFYVKAADNLKRARLAAKFKRSTTSRGSTPNPLPKPSFPDAGQTPGGSADIPASADPPTREIRKVSLNRDIGDTIHSVSYGLHVSSWQNPEKAQADCARLQKHGFTTWINTVHLGAKGTWHRVLVGNFATKAEAASNKASVKAALGVDSLTIYQRLGTTGSTPL